MLRRKKQADENAPDDAPEPPSPLEVAMEQIGASSAVAVRVMQTIDHPMSTAASVAQIVDLDPILTTQLLRVANSASFGALSSVASTSRAIALIGMSGVRSIAASAAVRGAGSTPPGFWDHSAAAAAGCVAASAGFGVAREEAFAIGLLHDLGWPLLDIVDADVHRAMTAESLDDTDLCIREAEHFGEAHDEIAARLLTSWNFPSTIIDAIGAHHLGPDGHRQTLLSPQAQVLLVGDALAHHLLESIGFHGEDLAAFGFSDVAAASLIELAGEYLVDIQTSVPR